MTDTYDTYANLSMYFSYHSLIPNDEAGRFLVNNYRQVLEILAGMPALQESMKALNCNPSTFSMWLGEERIYLKSLSTEPLQETHEMDYYTQLVQLNKLE